MSDRYAFSANSCFYLTSVGTIIFLGSVMMFASHPRPWINEETIYLLSLGFMGLLINSGAILVDLVLNPQITANQKLIWLIKSLILLGLPLVAYWYQQIFRTWREGRRPNLRADMTLSSDERRRLKAQDAKMLEAKDSEHSEI